MKSRDTATPEYLRFALAGECILSLREFAEQFPKLLEDFEPHSSGPRPR